MLGFGPKAESGSQELHFESVITKQGDPGERLCVQEAEHFPGILIKQRKVPPKVPESRLYPFDIWTGFHSVKKAGYEFKGKNDPKVEKVIILRALAWMTSSDKAGQEVESTSRLTLGQHEVHVI